MPSRRRQSRCRQDLAPRAIPSRCEASRDRSMPRPSTHADGAKPAEAAASGEQAAKPAKPKAATKPAAKPASNSNGSRGKPPPRFAPAAAACDNSSSHSRTCCPKPRPRLPPVPAGSILAAMRQARDTNGPGDIEGSVPWTASGSSTIRPACPPRSTPTQYASLVELLEESFAKFADRKAFICMGKAISYRRARRDVARARRLAAGQGPARAPASRS